MILSCMKLSALFMLWEESKVDTLWWTVKKGKIELFIFFVLFFAHVTPAAALPILIWARQMGHPTEKSPCERRAS